MNKLTYLLNIQHIDKQDKMYFFCRDANQVSEVFSLPYQPILFLASNCKQGSDDIKSIGNYKKIEQIQDHRNFKYYDNNKFQVFKLSFQNMQKYYYCMSAAKKNQNILICGNTISQEIHFICENNFKANGWIQIPIDGIKKKSDIVFREDIIQKIPCLTLSFDIETTSSTGKFPSAEIDHDRIIQIGMSFSDKTQILLNLGPLCESEDITIFDRYLPENINNIKPIYIQYNFSKDNDENEYNLIYDFFKIIKDKNPDIMIGYNIFNFDEKYIFTRMEMLSDRLKHQKPHHQLSRINGIYFQQIQEKRLQSSGLGKNDQKYIKSFGIVHIDVYQQIRQSYTNYSSYKLDAVCEINLYKKITKIEYKNDTAILTINQDDQFIEKGKYIKLQYKDDFELINTKKLLVLEKNEKQLIIQLTKNVEQIQYQSVSLVKDDVDLQVAFDLWSEKNKNINVANKIKNAVAKYCLQDCNLVLALTEKLDIINNGFQMSRICNIPFDFVFSRGQGIRILSLIYKECKKQNYIIPDSFEIIEGDKYQGGYVHEPQQRYYSYPIIVLDFEALYPNCMIDLNLSNETCVLYDQLSEQEQKEILPKLTVFEMQDGKKFYFLKKEYQQGIIPQILQMLLSQRKSVKKQMEDEKDDIKASVYNSIQLAYKVVANSVYGQTGSKFSQILCMEIAETTTAYGRQNIEKGIQYVKKQLKKDIRANPDYKKILKDYEYKPRIAYGDTDSIFIDMQYKHKKLKSVPRTEIVALSIQVGKIIQTLIKSIYTQQLNLRYEKCLTNLFIFAKKRYVGWIFEDNPNHKKLYMTGIVLKRKDNADIVKVVYKKLLKSIIDNENTFFEDDIETITNAMQVFQNQIDDILNNKINPVLFKTSRKLNDEYKDRSKIAHAVLVDRHEKKTGEKFGIGDRIEYLHIFDENTSLNKNAKQGDKIQLFQEYMKNQQNYNIDFIFYVNNQIKNPCIQIFQVLLDDSEITKIEEQIESKIQKIEDSRTQKQDVCIKQVIKQMLKEDECDENVFQKILTIIAPKKESLIKNKKEFQTEELYQQYLQEEMDKKNKADMKKKLKKQPDDIHEKRYPSLQHFIDEYVSKKEKCKYRIFIQKQQIINEYIQMNKIYKAKKELLLLLSEMQVQYLIDKGISFYNKIQKDNKLSMEVNTQLIQLLSLKTTKTKTNILEILDGKLSSKKTAKIGYFSIIRKYFD